MFVTGGAAAGGLVEDRPVEMEGRFAVAAISCNWSRPGIGHGLDRTTSSGSAGRGVVVYVHSTISDRGPGALVLREQAFLAGEAHFYLSALGHQHKLRLAMVVSVGCGSG